MFVCLFVSFYAFSQQYCSHIGGLFLNHRSPVLDYLPPCLTTKASPGDRTNAREVTGLEVIDSKPSTTEAVKLACKH
jgi:hypothetical protein